MTRLAPLAVLALAACSEAPEPAPEPAPPEPEAAAPAVAAPPTDWPVMNGVRLNQPLRLTGTEPFWGGEIGAGGLMLEGVDRPKVETSAVELAAGAGRVVWTGSTAYGPLVMAVTPGPCSDGMSDRVYPLTAEVTFSREVLRGCAASAEAFRLAGESGEVR